MGIGPRLRAVREARDWTQFQLGVCIGKRDTDISRWERESLMPRADIVILLCKALGCSADYLLGLKDDMGLDPYWVDKSHSAVPPALERLPEAPAEAPARPAKRQPRSSA